MTTPYYQDEHVTIYHGDNAELSHVIPADAAIVSDPPYGMNANTDSRRFSGGQRRRGHGVDHQRIVGDAKPFDPAPWLGFPEVILWGSNHYAQRLPVGSTLVWVKKAPHLFGTFLSDGEIGWHNRGHGVYVCDAPFYPTDKKLEAGQYGAHPTQKPLALMTWCLRRLRPTVTNVVDPYMGSGTTLAAAKALGLRAIGIEVDERYCEIAARRCSQETLALVGA